MDIRLLAFTLLINFLSENTKSATIITKAKNRVIFISTTGSETPEPPLMLVIAVSTIIPIMSSITAAPSIVVPILPESFPSSLKVSTVMLTEVAVSVTPIKRAFIKSTLGSPSGFISI